MLPLILAAILALRTLPRDSVTIDEFGNLPLTIAYWKPGALHIDRGNPPLTRWIQGLPFVQHPPELGATREELAAIETSWDLGYRFESAHANDYHALLVRARYASLAMLLATVLGVYFWAQSLAGPRAALVCATLAAVCPNLLAHGRLVTPDIGVTACLIWAAWAAQCAFDRPSMLRAVLAGLLAGIACLAKFSGVLAVPVFAAAVAIAPGMLRARAIRVIAFCAVLVLPLFVAYASPAWARIGGVPLPLPEAFVHGIATQLAEAPYPAYLFGHVREGGWLAYSVVAFAMKTPLAMIALAALSLVVIMRRRDARYALPLSLVFVFLVVFGLVTKKNVGIRYVLVVFPLLHVCASALFAKKRGALSIASISLFVVAIITGITASGAPLSSFNGLERLFGGKRQVLVDSNLDWGQALPDLHEWMERESIPIVQFAYFGRIDPNLYGITWRTLPTEPVQGAAAISASLAMGRPYLIRWKQRPMLPAEFGWSREDSWVWLKNLVPDEELGGGSILVWKDISKAKSK
ncbi:MAG TPA: glycosyltransferase family 39 protein [bacterium]|nr:glycosyltransferase family 39 protein [bacterium]